MASNRSSQQVRSAAFTHTIPTTAILAAAMVHLAGTTVSIAQVTPTTPPAGTPAPAAQPMGDKADPKADPKPDGGDKVHVDSNQIVDLHVNDEDLANVLEMLSIQSQKNIVASKSVTARVTANLYGVTFFEALEAILNVNGFGYVEDGNFIFVYTIKELEEIRKAQRIKVSKVVTLNYLNAVDAAEFVKPLLSEGAQIKTNGKMGSFPSPGDVPLGNEEYAGGATLVITDFDDHIGEIESLLRQLDTRPAQVLVEATIMQTTLTEDNAFGVDFSIIADMDFGDFFKIGGPVQAVNALISGADSIGRDNPLPTDGKAGGVSSNVGNAAGPGGLKLGIVKGDVAVFMRVLDEVTDSTILSNPKILALNRQPARVLVGRKVGYLSTTSTDTATTQTVEFLDTGTQLYFRPFVSNEGVIRMELKPQVSEAVIRESHDASGKDVTIPDEITNELVTNVMVHDGQTIVLGGLFRESTQSTRRQIPFLGDIPIIGYAFRGNEDNTQRNEIIFLVTPSIVNDQTLAAQGERGKEYIDHLRVGAREGVLFFSRDKLTRYRNLRAEKLFLEGDTEGALWNVERSLNLNHNQPEVVAMREKLTGHKSQWPTRSFMDRVLHGDTEQILKKGGSSQLESPMFPGAQNADADSAPNMVPISANFNTSFPSTTPSDTKPEDDSTPATPTNFTDPMDSTNPMGPTDSTTPTNPDGTTPFPRDDSSPNPGMNPDSPSENPNTPDQANDFTNSNTPTSPDSTPSPMPSDQDQPAPAPADADGQMNPEPQDSQNVNPADATNPTDQGDNSWNNSTPAPQNVPGGPVGAAKPISGGAHGMAGMFNVPGKHTAGTTPGFRQGAPVAAATGETQASKQAARLWCGRHSFMQGMWTFFKFSAGQSPTAPTITDAGEGTTPESTDR